MLKTRIEVSPEMLAFVGAGAVDLHGRPDDGIGMSFRLSEGIFSIDPDPVAAAADHQADLIFIVTASACRRLFAASIGERGTWHLPSDLRAIGVAVRDCAAPTLARETLQLAKSIELLCAVFVHLTENTLVPADAASALSEGDTIRVIAARRLIDERWHEKLTLESIARSCGINRAKLTRGFRQLFDCSIADALTENRLGSARRLLMATDLPVSSIGYRCGYLNNASFTRAFSRRYGLAPTRLRQVGLAA